MRSRKLIPVLVVSTTLVMLHSLSGCMEAAQESAETSTDTSTLESEDTLLDRDSRHHLVAVYCGDSVIVVPNTIIVDAKDVIHFAGINTGLEIDLSAFNHSITPERDSVEDYTIRGSMSKRFKVKDTATADSGGYGLNLTDCPVHARRTIPGIVIEE